MRSGCAIECLRKSCFGHDVADVDDVGHVGDVDDVDNADDVDDVDDVDVDTSILVSGAQKILRICCTPSVGLLRLALPIQKVQRPQNTTEPSIAPSKTSTTTARIRLHLTLLRQIGVTAFLSQSYPVAPKKQEDWGAYGGRDRARLDQTCLLTRDAHELRELTYLMSR